MCFNVMSLIFEVVAQGFARFRHRFAQGVWEQTPDHPRFVSFSALNVYADVCKCMQNPLQAIDLNTFYHRFKFLDDNLRMTFGARATRASLKWIDHGEEQ